MADDEGREDCVECCASGEVECEQCGGSGVDPDGGECRGCAGLGTEDCVVCEGEGSI